MPRLTRNRVFLLVLAAGALLLVLYDGAMMTIGDGAITYRVRLTSRVPVREAGAEVFGRPEWAEDMARTHAPEHLRHQLPPDALAGAPFEVRAWVTTRTSGLGMLRNTRVQARYLAVVAVLADGRRVAKVVELPEADPNREDDPEVTVALD